MKQPVASLWLGFDAASARVFLSCDPELDMPFVEEVSRRICDTLFQEWDGEEVMMAATGGSLYVACISEPAIRFAGPPKGSIPGRHAHLWRHFYGLMRGAAFSLADVDRFLRSEGLRKKIEMAIAIAALESGRFLDLLENDPANIGVFLTEKEIELEPGNLLIDVDVSCFYPFSGYVARQIALRAYLVATSASGIALARRVHENREHLIEGGQQGNVILTGLMLVKASMDRK